MRSPLPPSLIWRTSSAGEPLFGRQYHQIAGWLHAAFSASQSTTTDTLSVVYFNQGQVAPILGWAMSPRKGDSDAARRV